MMKIATVLVFLAFLSACSSDNEHFCAKYSYFYDELSEPDILPAKDIRIQLEASIKKRPTDRDRLMLMVLTDRENNLIRYGENASESCLRRERWKEF